MMLNHNAGNVRLTSIVAFKNDKELQLLVTMFCCFLSVTIFNEKFKLVYGQFSNILSEIGANDNNNDKSERNSTFFSKKHIQLKLLKMN